MKRLYFCMYDQLSGQDGLRFFGRLPGMFHYRWHVLGWVRTWHRNRGG